MMVSSKPATGERSPSASTRVLAPRRWLETLVHPVLIARPGSPIPRSPCLGLTPFTIAGVVPVQQAVAERVLAGQVRSYAQLPLHLAGDDSVLMVAEDRLDLLHLLGEPTCLLADRRGHCLAGVTGTLSRFARLMQCHIRGLAG